MRRLLVVLLVLAACGGAVAAASRGGSDERVGPRYTVELDNAFGLTQDADVKIAGVRAGRVTGMRVDRESQRALVDFTIEKAGFGSLRTDVFCETRPQSLIGEYFIDCRPGKAPQKLRQGATIPVEQTASTIPIDLINNVMRRPYRERLRIILDELGAGVGGRADQIQETLRRAVPALRETDRVLAILAEQNQVLKELTTNADTVIGDLSQNRRNVGRFARETRQTAAASAERRAEIAASLRRLPGFLRELRPTLDKLGAAADAQTPALADLNASAGQLERLFENLVPFSEASQESFNSLAELARDGRPALRATRPTIAELERFARDTPELAGNLAVVLRDLDDRKRAVEKDPRSPGGQGYTGLEALLQYVFDQTMAINAFDSNGYMLKVNLFLSRCSQYQNRKSLEEEMKKDPSFYSECASILGPNQPGITQPDPSYTGAQQGPHHAPPLPEPPGGGGDRPQPPQPPQVPQPPQLPQPPTGLKAPSVRVPAERVNQLKRRLLRLLRADRRKAAERLARRLERLGVDVPKLPPPGRTPQLPAPPTAPSAPQAPAVPQAPAAPQPPQPDPKQLLDFLFAP